MDANGEGLGVLVVGAGFLGARRAAAAVAARGTRLVGVTDVRREVADAVARRYGGRSVADLDEGLMLVGVDAVVVATPHADHAGQVRRALEAGKHVLCEKPLAIEPEDGRALATLAAGRGLILATGFNHRFYPPVRDALGLVEAGAIGRVESVRAQIGHRASAEFLGGWHADPARSGGGTLMDNGPHACDLVRRFLGEIVAAQGYVRDGLGLPDGCEAEAFALFEGREGGVAEMRSSWVLEPGYLTLDVRGAEGHLHVETAPWRLSGMLADGGRIDRHYVTSRAVEAIFRRRFGCERSLVHEMEAFAAGASGPNASGWDGCRATEMVRAVYESAEAGRAVRLEPLPVRLPGERKAGRREIAA